MAVNTYGYSTHRIARPGNFAVVDTGRGLQQPTELGGHQPGVWVGCAGPASQSLGTASCREEDEVFRHPSGRTSIHPHLPVSQSPRQQQTMHISRLSIQTAFGVIIRASSCCTLSLAIFFMLPRPTTGGERHYVLRLSLRPLTRISRAAMSLYVVERFQ